MRSIIIILLSYVAFTVGCFVGYNKGYDMGKVIGKLDSKMCFLHNGVQE